MPPLPQQQQPIASPLPPVPAQATPQAQQPVDWRPFMANAAKQYQLNPDLLNRVIKQESGGNVRAVSPKGAQGLMQLMPETAKRYGADPFDPQQNLNAGTQELRRLFNKYDTPGRDPMAVYYRALAAYNAGEGTVDNAKSFEDLPAETQQYVNAIMQGYQMPQQAQPKPVQQQQAGPQQQAPLSWFDQLSQTSPELRGLGAMFGHQTPGAQPFSPGMEKGLERANVVAQLGPQAGEWLGKQMGDYMGSMFTTEQKPVGIPLEHPEGTGVAAGIARGVGQTIGSTAGNPTNWPFFAAGPFNLARPILAKIISGGFTAQMGSGTLEAAKDLYQNWDRYTPEQRAERMTSSGLAALFTTLGAKDTLSAHPHPATQEPGAQPGVVPGREPAAAVPQTGPAQAPNIGVEGGPRPVTQAGVTGAQEVTGRTQGQQIPAQASAPIEGAGLAAGTGAPSANERRGTPDRREDRQVLLDDAKKAVEAGNTKLAASLLANAKTKQMPVEGERRLQDRRQPITLQPGEDIEKAIGRNQVQNRQILEQALAEAKTPELRKALEDEIRAMGQGTRKPSQPVTTPPITPPPTPGQAARLPQEDFADAGRRLKDYVQGQTRGPETPAPTPSPANIQPVRTGQEPARPAGESLRPSQEPLSKPVPTGQQVANKRIQASAGQLIPSSPDEAIKLLGKNQAEEFGLTTPEGLKRWQETHIKQFVEDRAQPLVRKLLTEGKRPTSSNVYGPGRKGVDWIDSKTGQEGFTPLEAKKPYTPLPPEQRPRVPAGGVRVETTAPVNLPAGPPPEPPSAQTPRPKSASAEQLEEWKQTRRDEAAERAGVMKEEAQYPISKKDIRQGVEPASGLNRTMTRFLKTEPSPHRDAELKEAVLAVRRQGPEAMKTEGENARQRALRAQGMAEWGLQQLDPTRQEFIKEMRGERVQPEGGGRSVRVPGRLGAAERQDFALPDAYAEWAERRGLEFDPRTNKERYGWTSQLAAHDREAINRALGNQMREVGTRRDLTPEEEAFGKNLERKRDELVAEMRKHPAPTQRQLDELAGTINGLHATYGTRWVAERGPQAQIGEHGELLGSSGLATNREMWNRFMERPAGEHGGRPTEEQVRKRIEFLKREATLARGVAKSLGVQMPEPTEAALAGAKSEAKPEVAPEAAPEVKSVPTEEAPKTPPPAPAEPTLSEEDALSDIANLPREAREAFQGLNAQEQKEFVERYRAGQHPELDVLAPERLVKEPSSAPTTEPKPAPKPASKPAPAKAEEPIRGAGVPSPRMQDAIRRELNKPHVERPVTKPGAQAAYEGERQAVLDEFAKQKTAHDARLAEVKAFREVHPQDYTPAFLDRLTKYGNKLADIEGRHEFLTKLNEARAAFQRGDNKAGHAATTSAIAMADQRLVPPKMGRLPVEPGTGLSGAEPPRPGGKGIAAEEKMDQLGARIGGMARGEDRSNLERRHQAVGERLADLNNRIKLTNRNINALRKSGKPSRSYTNAEGKTVTENLQQLEHRVMLLGRDRAELAKEDIPSLEAAIDAIGRRPVAKAPAPTPTKAEPTRMTTYGPGGEKTGEKTVVPSEAPLQEGLQYKQEELQRAREHLANLIKSAGDNARGTSQLRKEIREMERQLGVHTPDMKPGVAETLEGSGLLRAAGVAGTPRPEVEKEPLEYKPVVDPTADLYDHLNDLAKKVDRHGEPVGEVPLKSLEYINKVLPDGQTKYESVHRLSRPIIDALRKGDIGADVAARRFERSLRALYEGLQKSAKLSEEERIEARRMAVKEAERIARGEGPKSEAGFFGRPPGPKAGRVSKFGGLVMGRSGMAAAERIKAERLSEATSEGASQEALSRQAAEKAKGVRIEVTDTRSGRTMPLVGPEAHAGDIRPGRYDRIERVYPDGRRELISEGQSARPTAPKDWRKQAGFASLGRKRSERAKALSAKKSAEADALREAVDKNQPHEIADRLDKFVKTLPKGTVDERIKAVHEAIGTTPSTAPGRLRQGLTNMYANMKTFASWYWNGERNGIKLRDAMEGISDPKVGYKEALGKYNDAYNISAKDAHEVVSGMLKAHHPDVLKAMHVGMDVDFNADVLKKAASNTKLPEDLRKAALLATQLSPRELEAAKAYSNYFKETGEVLSRVGALRHMLETYVPHVLDLESTSGQKFMAELRAGVFDTNFRYARQRMHENMFEGAEKGAKYNLGIARAIWDYHKRATQAIGSRGFIKELSGVQQADGRTALLPEYSSIRPILPSEYGRYPIIKEILDANPEVRRQLTEAYMFRDGRGAKAPIADASVMEALGVPYDKDTISANDKARMDVSDYKLIDHPDFKQTVFIGKGPDGKPIFYRADLYAHPAIYRDLKNIYENSQFRTHRLTQAMLKVTAGSKRLLLKVLPSGFHYSQEGLHSIGHNVNPFAKKIWSGDLARDATNDPIVRRGLRSGLQLYEYDYSDAMEGIKGVRGFEKDFENHLFGNFIPGLKIDTFKKQLASNLRTYGEKGYSEQRIYEMTAQQVNNAYGMQNRLFTGRTKFMQDMFRLAALAPDFFESRARFVGSAFRPGGRHQALALMRLGMYMYGTARVLNAMTNDGDAKWSPEDAFTWHWGGHEFSMRSVLTDTIFAVTDFSHFAVSRGALIPRAIFEEGEKAGTPKFVKSGHGVVQSLIRSVTPIVVQRPAMAAYKQLYEKKYGPSIAWETFAGLLEAMVGIREKEEQKPSTKRAPHLPHVRGLGTKQ